MTYRYKLVITEVETQRVKLSFSSKEACKSLLEVIQAVAVKCASLLKFFAKPEQMVKEARMKLFDVSIEEITSTVCSYFSLPKSALISDKRTKEVAHARMVSMYIAREFTMNTLESIGNEFNRDHATVSYAHAVILRDFKKDDAVHRQINSIVNSLKLTRIRNEEY